MSEIPLEELRERALEVEPPAEPLQRLVAIVIIVVTLLAAATAYLETRADSAEARAAREAQGRAVQVGIDLLESGARRSERRMLSGASDELRSVGVVLERFAEQLRLAPEHSLALGRAWRESGGRLEQLEELLFGADRDAFDAALARPALREGEFQKAFAEERDAWSERRGRLIAVITILAVSLFLLGLTLTVPGAARGFFFGAGCLVALAAVGWGAWVVSSSPAGLPGDASCVAARDRNRLETAICEYVEGRILQDFGTAEGPEDERRLIRRSIARFDRALSLAPRYEEAYRARGKAHIAGDFAASGGPRGSEAGRADFERAVELDPRDAAAWASLADAQFWLRDDAGALRSVERAIALRPRDPRFALDRALYLLANERPDAYDDQLLRVARAHGSIPDWLRDAVNRDFARDLRIAEQTRPELRDAVERLRGALGKTITEIDAAIRTFGPSRTSPKPLEGARIRTPASPRISPDGKYLVIELVHAGIDPARLLLYDVYLNGDRVLTVGPEPWGEGPGRPKRLSIPVHPGVFRAGDRLDLDLFLDGNLMASVHHVVPGGAPA